MFSYFLRRNFLPGTYHIKSKLPWTYRLALSLNQMTLMSNFSKSTCLLSIWTIFWLFVVLISWQNPFHNLSLSLSLLLFLGAWWSVFIFILIISREILLIRPSLLINGKTTSYFVENHTAVHLVKTWLDFFMSGAAVGLVLMV